MWNWKGVLGLESYALFQRRRRLSLHLPHEARRLLTLFLQRRPVILPYQYQSLPSSSFSYRAVFNFLPSYSRRGGLLSSPIEIFFPDEPSWCRHRSPLILTFHRGFNITVATLALIRFGPSDLNDSLSRRWWFEKTGGTHRYTSSSFYALSSSSDFASSFSSLESLCFGYGIDMVLMCVLKRVASLVQNVDEDLWRLMNDLQKKSLCGEIGSWIRSDVGELWNEWELISSKEDDEGAEKSIMTERVWSFFPSFFRRVEEFMNWFKNIGEWRMIDGRRENFRGRKRIEALFWKVEESPLNWWVCFCLILLLELKIS